MTVGEMYPGGLCLYIFRALLRIVIAGSWSDLQRSARERSVFFILWRFQASWISPLNAQSRDKNTN